MQGLTKHGATQQTIAISRAARFDRASRELLINALLDLNEPESYCHENGDKTARIAVILAEMCRSQLART